jgi:DNA-binding beta-propeller fold protein YncE
VRKLIFVLLAVSQLFLLSCAGPRQAKPEAAGPITLGWPEPPQVPRIVYIQSLHQPADAQIKTSPFVRFGRWLTASHEEQSLRKPFGIGVDEKGNLCITDTGANAVCFYDRRNKKWQRWLKVGQATFIAPVAVAKRHELIYVADSGRPGIVAFTESGKFMMEITNKVERPSGLLIHGERLLVTDSKRHSVLSYDLSGNFLSESGHRGINPGEFNFPTHIAGDSEGNIFITDSMNSRIQVLDRDFKFKTQIGSAGDSSGHFSRPKGLAVDTFGHVYVVDGMFDNIQVFDRAGKFLLYLGTTGAGAGEFWLPNGIAISSDNEVFVTDCYNQRVQIFKYIGKE